MDHNVEMAIQCDQADILFSAARSNIKRRCLVGWRELHLGDEIILIDFKEIAIQNLLP
jgi:hypothetical protein